MTEMPQPRTTTPAIIYFALACFVFAIATPIIAELNTRRSPGDGWHALGIYVVWIFSGGGAALLGVICTCIGAWRSPRSVATLLTIVLAALFTLFFLFLLSLAAH
jgi:uncharacterized membrane protein YczE